MHQTLSTKDPRLISYNTIRKTIGWLGILLPLAMISGNWLFGSCNIIQDSNSHYYYTVMGNLLTGILCAVAMFLIAYKGFEKIDHLATSFAGICALGIAMFPTNKSTMESPGCVVIDLSENGLRNAIHIGSAAMFFITLAVISWFLFTKSRGPKTKQKEKRNTLYRACGLTIVGAIALILLYWIFAEELRSFDKYKPVFWLEWVALIAFGLSWLVKGELILEDKKRADN